MEEQDAIIRKREKQRLAQRAWRAANPERHKATQQAYADRPGRKEAQKESWKRFSGTQKYRDYRARTKDSAKSLLYTRRYRGPKDADLIPQVFELQGSVCAICKCETPGKRTWHADHNHETGLLNGLLCALCNTGLGLLHDSLVKLHGALTYLQKPPASVISLPERTPELTPQEKEQLKGRRKKGMTNAEWFPCFIAFQLGHCAICTTQDPGKHGWNADHDHKTGLLRGALCSACNAGLGRFQDSIPLLEAAIAYLQDPPAAQVRRVL